MRLLVLPLLTLACWSRPAPAAPVSLAARISPASKQGGVVIVSENQRGFYQRLSIGRGKHLVIRASTPVVFAGQGAEHAFRVLSGGRLTIEGPIRFEGYDRAIFCTTAEGLTIRGASFVRNLRTPILTGKTSNVLIEKCTVEGVQDGHGIYLSEGGTNLTIRGNTVRKVSKSAVQVNGCPYRCKTVRIEQNTLTDAGNAALNLASITGLRVAGNSIARTRQGTVLFSDGRRKCRVETADLRAQAGPLSVDRWAVRVLLPPTAVRAATFAGGRRPAH